MATGKSISGECPVCEKGKGKNNCPRCGSKVNWINKNVYVCPDCNWGEGKDEQKNSLLN